MKTRIAITAFLLATHGFLGIRGESALARNTMGPHSNTPQMAYARMNICFGNCRTREMPVFRQLPLMSRLVA